MLNFNYQKKSFNKLINCILISNHKFLETEDKYLSVGIKEILCTNKYMLNY